MGSENKLTQLRRIFQIPDSVLIVAGEKFAPERLRRTRIGHQPDGKGWNVPQGSVPDEGIYYGKLGTRVYTDLSFLSMQYTDNQGKVVNTPKKTYYEILVQVTQAKKIIRTEIQGADGTVKEYIGLDDYKVTIAGVITGENGIRPMDEISDLKKILDAPIALDVACDYLRILGIDSLVVESYDIGEAIGSYSYQPFSIECVSDIPVQLRINGI